MHSVVAGCAPPASPTSPVQTPAPQATAIAAGAAAWSLLGCQSCHGALAEGASGPSLRHTALDRDEFLAWVRRGGQTMRGYSDEEVGDAAALAMHAWLQSLPSERPTAIPNAFGLTVPPGVHVDRFAHGLSHLTALAFADDGVLHAATAGAGATGGQVWRLPDGDADGQADRAEPVAANLQEPAALLWLAPADGAPVLVVGGAQGLAVVCAGTSLAQALPVVLPGIDRFQVNSLALGPDGYVYLAQGPPFDDLSARSPLPGAVWRFPADVVVAGGAPVVAERFASGMRNVSGLAFSPSGALYATENGRGWPDDPAVPSELNLLLGGGDYGWPAVAGQPPADSGTLAPMAEFAPGSVPGPLVFHSGRLFSEYANDLLVADAGTSPGLVRVEIVSDAAGYHSFLHPFVAGLGRPVSLAEGPDGALYVADGDAGVIYRLWR